MIIDKIIPLKEAAEKYGDILGTYRTLQNRIYSQQIPYYKIGRQLFVNPYEVVMECRMASKNGGSN